MSAIESDDLDERQPRGIDRQTALTPEDAEAGRQPQTGHDR
jgi:hypothetical protein